jgi:anti-sigma B factor antagonist
MSFAVSRTQLQDGVQVLAVKGQLDAHSYYILKDELGALLQELNNKVILDCNELEYISSAGLGVLKQMRKEFGSKGGDIRLTRLPIKIANILDLLGFSKIIKSFKSNEKGIASYKSD